MPDTPLARLGAKLMKQDAKRKRERLANAAPELLAALKEAVLVVADAARRSGDLHLNQTYSDLETRCRAAIKKAERG